MKKVKILPGLVMCAWLFLVKRHFCITNSWLLAWLLGLVGNKWVMAFGRLFDDSSWLLGLFGNKWAMAFAFLDRKKVSKYLSLSI